MDHVAKSEVLMKRATDTYAEAASYGLSVSSLYHALHSAHHEGWMRGFAAHEEITKRYSANYEPWYFILGAAAGFALALVLLVNK